MVRYSCGDSENTHRTSHTFHIVNARQVKGWCFWKCLSMQCEILRFRGACLPDGFSILTVAILLTADDWKAVRATMILRKASVTSCLLIARHRLSRRAVRGSVVFIFFCSLNSAAGF